MAGARPALVAVGVGDDTDLVAGAQRVLQQPLEASPVGVDLDDGLELRIVEADDVGVAAADVGDEQDVVAPRELLEQIGDRKAVRRRVGHVVDLGVRRAVQGGQVRAEHHVAIAAARRHAGPLVADEDHAAPVGMESVDLPA
jgi:hypothetical protein